MKIFYCDGCSRKLELGEYRFPTDNGWGTLYLGRSRTNIHYPTASLCIDCVANILTCLPLILKNLRKNQPEQTLKLTARPKAIIENA